MKLSGWLLYLCVTVVLALPGYGQWDAASLDAGEWVTQIVETDSGHIFAATLSGKGWVQDPSSGVWAEFQVPNTSVVWSIWKHPDGHVIADNGNDLFSSEDGGVNWTQIAPFGKINGFSAIGENWVVTKGVGGAVYRSINAGGEWFLANGSMLPLGWDNYSSDAIYDGQVLLYRYTEDPNTSYILRQTESFLPFSRPSGVFERAVTFDVNAPNRFFALTTGTATTGIEGGLIVATDLLEWSGVSGLPVAGLTELSTRGDRIAVASMTDLYTNWWAGQDGEWIQSSLPSGTQIITSLLIDSSEHILLGTECCLFRSRNPISTTGTPVEEVEQPVDTIGQPYPNPSAGSVRIPITSKTPQPMQVLVVDISGRERVLLRESSMIGTKSVVLPGGLAPGVYLIRISVGEKTTTRKIVIAH